jgi:hypothetical protein
MSAIAKHTKRTLFHVFAGRNSGVRNFVSNLVKEHIPFELPENDLTKTFSVSEVLRSHPVYKDICSW